MKDAMFRVGDMVKVKDLSVLRKEFGGDDTCIDTPCTFIDAMFKYCGRVMEVVKVYSNDVRGYFYYELNHGDGWNFDECVLEDFLDDDEPQFDIGLVSMGYESLFQ